MALTTLVDNGPSLNRVDIVLIGEGYTEAELDTVLVEHAGDLAEFLFDGGTIAEPFDSYERFFNLHLVALASPEAGADRPDDDLYVDTLLDASYSWGGSDDRVLYVDQSIAQTLIKRELEGTGIDADIEVVTVNSEKYGGAAGRVAVYAGGNGRGERVAIHEIGHSYAGLADEYFSSDRVIEFEEEYTFRQPNLTSDPTGAKWGQWLGYEDPDLGLGPVGVYEGAAVARGGVFRPSADSKMRQISKPFDPVAREAFVRLFYEEVDPLDDWAFADAQGTVANPGTLWVAPIDPELIEVRWEVDGAPAGVGPALSLADLDLGTYAVTAVAEDTTDWVRGDRSELVQSVSWTVDITRPPAAPPEAQPDIVSARSGATLLIDPLADNGNGPDEGTDIAVAAVGAPGDGLAAVLDDGRVLYRSDPGFAGDDGFDYRLDDASGAGVEGLVEVEVAPAATEGLSLAEAQAVGYLYEAAFDRLPDAGGLDHWIGAREEGLDERALAEAFLASEEAAERLAAESAPNDAFVSGLYANVFDREGDAGGLAYWTGKIDQGLTDRPALLLDFALSWENALGAPEIATLAEQPDGGWALA